MVFIQPGGEGSAGEAQPLLDRFFAEIGRAGGPSVSGGYYNTRNDGIEALKRADLAILPLDLYLQVSRKMSLRPILSIKPLGVDDGIEKYHVIVHKDVQDLKTSPITKIYTSHLISDGFVRLIALKDIPMSQTVNLGVFHAPDIVAKLKQVALKEELSAILLNAYEMESFKKMNLDWKELLKLYYRSPPVPTSPVVLVKTLPDRVTDRLTRSLLKVASSSQGMQVLNELRIEGFADPQKKLYEELDSMLR